MPHTIPMMKKLLVPVLLALILCVSSASAESCYVLPEGWYYNSEGQIVGPEEWYSNTTGQIVGYPVRTYESIWDAECIRRLKSFDRGYGNIEYMDQHLRMEGNTYALANDKVSITLLAGSAAIMISLILARKTAGRASESSGVPYHC